MLVVVLAVALALAAESLYVVVAKREKPETQQQLLSLEKSLAAISLSELLPSDRVSRLRAELLAAAGDSQRAEDMYKVVLETSVASSRDWYFWLSNALRSGADSSKPSDVTAGVLLLDSLANNNVAMRLGLSKMGLRVWYQLSAEGRQAFRRHLDWMADYNPNMLWRHAQSIRRELLLCRIYNDDGIELPLCRS